MSRASIPRRLHDIITSTAAASASASASASAATSAAASTTPKPSTTKLTRLIKLVNNFKKNCDSAEFRYRFRSYDSIVNRLARAKNFSLIEDLLEHQKQYDEFSTEPFMARLINLYGKSGMFDHAQKVFDEMPERKCERTVLSFNMLLSACVNSKKFDKFEELFRELPEKLGITPDVVSYNTQIKAFCDMGNLDSALLMVDEFEKNGMEADLVTYNTLLDAFYKNGRFLDGEKIWNLMESKNVAPNVRSYNPKLRGLISENRILEATGLICEMRSRGIKPDVYSYNALIIGFCKDDKLDEAKRWYREIEKNGCVPNRMSVMTLVPVLCEKGDLEMAHEVCMEAIDRRLLLNTQLLQSVVGGLVKGAKLEEAMALVERGKSNNYFRYKLELPLQK